MGSDSVQKGHHHRVRSKGVPPSLELPPVLFCDEALRRIVDEWLVPNLVDRYVGEKLKCRKDRDNGSQPL